jgi:hypothetical protein
MSVEFIIFHNLLKTNKQTKIHFSGRKNPKLSKNEKII